MLFFRFFFFFFTVFKEFGLSISRIAHQLVGDTTNKSKDFSVVCSLFLINSFILTLITRCLGLKEDVASCIFYAALRFDFDRY